MKNSKEILNRLLSLPMFSGLNYDDVIQIAGYARLDFHEVAAGETIVREGEPNNRIIFMITGTVLTTSYSDDRAYSITENLESPFAFQPETMFGKTQYFVSTLTALTSCSYLVLSKRDVVRISETNEVFRFNLFRFISTSCQMLYRRLWRVPPQTASEAVVRFLQLRCLKPAGQKNVHIKLSRLAEETGFNYLAVSKAIAKMKEEGLLMHSRGEIKVPAFERLIKEIRS